MCRAGMGRTLHSALPLNTLLVNLAGKTNWVISGKAELPLNNSTLVLFLHDSRDCPETAVSLLHQKRLGSGSEPTKEKIKLLK